MMQACSHSTVMAAVLLVFTGIGGCASPKNSGSAVDLFSAARSSDWSEFVQLTAQNATSHDDRRKIVDLLGAPLCEPTLELYCVIRNGSNPYEAYVFVQRGDISSLSLPNIFCVVVVGFDLHAEGGVVFRPFSAAIESWMSQGYGSIDNVEISHEESEIIIRAVVDPGRSDRLQLSHVFRIADGVVVTSKHDENTYVGTQKEWVAK